MRWASRGIVILQLLSIHKSEAGSCKLCSFFAWSFHTGGLSKRSNVPIPDLSRQTHAAICVDAEPLRLYESSTAESVVCLHLPASVFDGLRQRDTNQPGQPLNY